jgi:16S rRNA (guanine966-N2)-methyltransferase
MDKGEIMNQDARMIIRTRRQKNLPLDLECLMEYRADNYGESTLHYYKQINEEDIKK